MTKPKTVHRFEIPINDQSVECSGIPVHVDMKFKSQQHLDLWVEVDAKHNPRYDYRVFGTGHNIPGDWTHCGSVVDARSLVWHLYRSWEKASLISCQCSSIG